VDTRLVKVIVMNVIHILVVLSAPSFLVGFNGSVSQDLKRKKAFLVRKHLKRLKKVEGAIKLVGGRAEFEGNY
jgi:hypothetical protein